MFVTYLLHSYLLDPHNINACMPSRLVSLTLNFQHTYIPAGTEFRDVTY